MHNNAHPDWNAVAPCDAHMHLYRGRSFAWNLQMMRGYMEWFGLERAALMALPAMTEIPWWRDDGSNLRCLGVKAALNAENPARKVYAFAGLHLGDGDEEVVRVVGWTNVYAALSGLREHQLHRFNGRALQFPEIHLTDANCINCKFTFTVHNKIFKGVILCGVGGVSPSPLLVV